MKSDEVTVNNEIKKKTGRAKKQLTEEEMKEKVEKQQAYFKAHYEKHKILRHTRKKIENTQKTNIIKIKEK